jgi:hypothetical protein
MALPSGADLLTIFTPQPDGRLTTEGNAAMLAAQSVMLAGRHIRDIDELRAALLVILAAYRAQATPATCLLPLAGMIDGSFERGIWRGSFKKRLTGLGMGYLSASYKAQAQMIPRLPGAGWADYHIAHWLMTGSPAAIDELCKLSGSSPTALHAIEMVSTQIQDFHTAMMVGWACFHGNGEPPEE